MHESSSCKVVQPFEQRGNVSEAPVSSSCLQRYSVSPSFFAAQCGAPAVSPIARCVPVITVTAE